MIHSPTFFVAEDKNKARFLFSWLCPCKGQNFEENIKYLKKKKKRKKEQNYVRKSNVRERNSEETQRYMGRATQGIKEI